MYVCVYLYVLSVSTEEEEEGGFSSVFRSVYLSIDQCFTCHAVISLSVLVFRSVCVCVLFCV